MMGLTPYLCAAFTKCTAPKMFPWSVMATAGMPSSGHALAEFFDVAGAIEQGVIGMEVQVDELGHGAQYDFTLALILMGNDARASGIVIHRDEKMQWKDRQRIY